MFSFSSIIIHFKKRGITLYCNSDSRQAKFGCPRYYSKYLFNSDKLENIMLLVFYICINSHIPLAHILVASSGDEASQPWMGPLIQHQVQWQL